MSQNRDAPETESETETESTHSRRTFLAGSALGLAGLAAAGAGNAAAATTWEDHDHSGDYGGKTNLGASSPVSSITVDDVLTRESPRKNVQAYGAAGDGSTDDTAAVQSAFDAAGDGDVVFFPPGTYKLSSAITQSGKSLSVVGAGIDTTVLECTHSGNGLALSFDAAGQPDAFTLRGLSIRTTASDAGSALDATWDSRQSSIYPHCRVENVEVRGTSPTSNGWTNGLVLDDAWNTVIHGVNVVGRGPSVGTAIKLEDRAVDVTIANVYAYYHGTGVRLPRSLEGTHVTDATIVAVDNGLVTADASDGNYEPLFSVVASHVNARKRALKVRDWAQFAVLGSLFYKRSGSTEDYVGVRAVDTKEARVTNNAVVVNNTDGANNGIVFSDSTTAVVTGNQILNADTGVWFQSSTSDSIARCNTSRGTGNVVFDEGTGNVVGDNIEA